MYSYLQSSFVLDIDDVELIKLERTSRQKSEKLLTILLSKERNVFGHFYDALKYAEYSHLCDLLESGVNGDRGDLDSDEELPDGKDCVYYNLKF